MKEKDNNIDLSGIARKISDGFYINVNRIPTHNINYDQDELEALGSEPNDDTFEKMKDNLQNTDSILPKDKDQGNETIGIP